MHKRVIDYINEANPEKVIEAYRASYCDEEHECPWANFEVFNKFRSVLNDKVGVKRDDVTIVIRYVYKDWKDPVLGIEEYFDVSGRIKGEESLFAMEFAPWGEWKLYPVVDESNKNLTTEEIAAHLYYEITWGGWEEQGQERLAEINDRMEEVMRSIDNKDSKG